MPMKKRLFLFTIACTLVILFESCHTGKQTVSYHSSRQPKFIKNVYIAPHHKSNGTVNAIDHSKRQEQATNNSGAQHAETPIIAKGDEEPILTRHESKVIRKKYAGKLGISPRQIDNFALYKFIDKWYGVRYRIGGCDANGIDCSGFAQKLYSEVYGIDLLRTAVDQFSNCKRIKNSKKASEGDLVFFCIGTRRISHVGVYLANNYFVHASTSNGVMISNLDEDYWHKHYAGCGRVPGTDLVKR